MNGRPGTGAPEENRPRIKRPARVFISYAEQDAGLRAELDDHLAALRKSGHVLVWHDRMIRPGDDRAGAVHAELEAADLVLLLVSASFFASSSCFDVELARALERHRRGETRVIPVLVRACDWTTAPFGALEAVPCQPGKGATPVTAWSDRDAAWASVARALRSLLENGPDAASDVPSQRERQSDPRAPTRPRSRAVAGVLVAGIVAAGIAAGVAIARKKNNEDATPSAPSPPPVDTPPPSSAPPPPSAPPLGLRDPPGAPAPREPLGPPPRGARARSRHDPDRSHRGHRDRRTGTEPRDGHALRIVLVARRPAERAR